MITVLFYDIVIEWVEIPKKHIFRIENIKCKMNLQLHKKHTIDGDLFFW